MYRRCRHEFHGGQGDEEGGGQRRSVGEPLQPEEAALSLSLLMVRVLAHVRRHRVAAKHIHRVDRPSGAEVRAALRKGAS